MVARWCLRGGRWVASSLLVVALLTVPGAPRLAHADDATSKAREAFQTAIKLEEARSYADALVKFREVAAVKKTPQVLFHVGFCQEKLGQWVEARATYQQATQLTSQANDAKTVEARTAINQALASLEQRLPSLQLARGKGASNAAIMIDGQRVDDVNTPLRLMPGKHLIQARAKNKDNFRSEINLVEGQRVTIEIALDDIDDGSGPPATKPGKPEKPEKPEKNDKASQPPEKGSGRSIAPYVFLGVGGASLAASGVFFLLRNSAEKDLKSQCIGLACPSSAKSTGDSARTMNTLSNVTVSVGAVGVATGLIWLLATRGDPAPEKSTTSLRVVPEASSSQLGAGLVGQF